MARQDAQRLTNAFMVERGGRRASRAFFQMNVVVHLQGMSWTTHSHRPTRSGVYKGRGFCEIIVRSPCSISPTMRRTVYENLSYLLNLAHTYLDLGVQQHANFAEDSNRRRPPLSMKHSRQYIYSYMLSSRRRGIVNLHCFVHVKQSSLTQFKNGGQSRNLTDPLIDPVPTLLTYHPGDHRLRSTGNSTSLPSIRHSVLLTDCHSCCWLLLA